MSVVGSMMIRWYIEERSKTVFLCEKHHKIMSPECKLCKQLEPMTVSFGACEVCETKKAVKTYDCHNSTHNCRGEKLPWIK